MKVSDFDYYLPDKLIAQRPIDKRSNSRLLVLDRTNASIAHEQFYNITKYLQKGDILVLNNTKVIPARLFAYKEDTKAKIEILLLKEVQKDVYSCLAKPAKRLKEGSIINVGKLLKGRVIKKLDEGICHIHFTYEGIFLEILEKIGEMPLPPYIHEKLENKDSYQTVFAKVDGSAAAPTAGLHFTKELLNTLVDEGIQLVYITLHVGLGTFRPLSVEKVEDHKMHSEYYELDKKAAKILNEAKKAQKRIISVGTTTTRVLESNIKKFNKFQETKEETDIFIYPGFKFEAIDALITNFHLPRSSLLMLVSALANKEYILKAYDEAINMNYRFFSFGDAMFIK